MQTERSQWNQLWSNWEVRADTASWYQGVLDAYGDPARHYHNLRHVCACLEMADALQEVASDFDAVRAALWFHDIVYDPRSATNEHDSAVSFLRFAQSAKLDPDRTREVVRLIELTAGHEVKENDRNGAVMMDADLAILGASSTEYRDYAAGIRAEYAMVPIRDYARKRSEILACFVERPVLFQTAWMRERRERQARLNLRTEIEELSLVS